jgi:hypothetical protein
MYANTEEYLMSFDQLLKDKQYDLIWKRYCGFLDLSIPEFMAIQKSLLLEQIELYAHSEIGKKIMKNKHPKTVEEFRKMVPLTEYEDYADILLSKNEAALPAKPMVWIETTWVGGKAPVKVAPYSEAMIKNYRDACLACIILASSQERGKFTLHTGMNFLNGMAPLPYLTGLLPDVLHNEFSVNYFPPIKEGLEMGFSQRNKEGFKMGLQQGLDLFYGLSSVIVRMSEQFSEGGKSKTKLLDFRINMLLKLAKAKLMSRINHKPLLPKDVFNLKGFVCIGTDTLHFKKKIEAYWGIKPLEVFGGTEITCIAIESWAKEGLILLPNICFYEFIPMSEFYKNLEDPTYQCKTYTMDQLKEDEYYELVITNLKGGVFARYRAGDLFKCEVSEYKTDGIKLPHFRYIDRIDPIIDLAGFTRITEATITEVIALSHLHIYDWFARKCYDGEQRPFINLCIELNHPQNDPGIDNAELIKEQLEIYFKYIDQDYKSLFKMLGIEPLRITILPFRTIEKYQKTIKHKLSKVNPNHYDVVEIMNLAYGTGDQT